MSEEEMKQMLMDACRDGLKFLASLPTTQVLCQLENREAYKRILDLTLAATDQY